MKARASALASRLELCSAGLYIDVALPDGTLSFADRNGWRPMPAAWAEVELDGEVVSSLGRPWGVVGPPARIEDVHGAGIRALLASERADVRLLLDLCVYDNRRFALLRLGVENRGRSTRRVRRFAPLKVDRGVGGGLALAAPVSRWRFLRHGWQSWTPSLALSGAQRDLDARPPVHAPAPPPEGRGQFASEEVGVVLHPDARKTLLLGFVTAERDWAQVRLDAGRRAIEARSMADGMVLRPGETLWSERLAVDVADDSEAALRRYADALGREMGARIPPAPPTGWCSWYHYFREVTEADVLANLRALQDRRRALPFEYVQIDDGYQREIGDWLDTNEAFPHGMAWLAREIHAAGLKAGIWLAPFLVGAQSRLFAEHPDWVVRDDEDRPVVALRNWGQDCYALDCTHPGADAWLRDVFAEIAANWGYDYVKIDFLYAAAVAGRRHDARMTRIEAYRRGLHAIREAVGERFVLGCGALMGPSVGLVDGQRIGPDVAPWWRFDRPLNPPRERGRPTAGGEPSVEHALRNVLTRSWMHGRLWANDPDCLLARDVPTKLSLAEVQSLATAIAFSGGMVLDSDDLTRLAEDRVDIVSLLLPPLGEAAAVPDLLTESMPSRMLLELRRSFGSWLLLGCFNWSGRRRSVEAPLPSGRWRVFELWDERDHGVQSRRMPLDAVPAHGVRLLTLRPALERPQLLSTTFHWSMGGREVEQETFDRRRNTLRLRLRPVAKKHGVVYVAVPRGLRFEDARLGRRRIEPSRRERGLLGFNLELSEPVSLAVRFASSRA